MTSSTNRILILSMIGVSFAFACQRIQPSSTKQVVGNDARAVVRDEDIKAPLSERSTPAVVQFGMGSCLSALDTVHNSLVHCSISIGQLDGGELACACLSDGFSKPGNNGTISCGDFCYGGQWGDLGNCIGATTASNNAPISCDDATGQNQNCFCGKFRQP